MDPGRITSDYSIIRTVYNVSGNGPFLIAHSDPSRVYLLIAVITDGNVAINTTNDFRITASNAFPAGLVVQYYEHFKLRLAEDGPMVQSEWFAWSMDSTPQGTGSIEVAVWEVTKIRPTECY